MIVIDGQEYVTKEEATEACRAFVAANPGARFGNHAFYKIVFMPRTEAEREAEKAKNGGCYHLDRAVLEYQRLPNQATQIKRHPELKGMWFSNEVAK